MKDKLNVAVIGAGVFGAVHIAAYHQYARANLVKVCDANAERAAGVREKYGVETCADYHELLHDGRIDAVSVVTPDFLHRDIAIALMEAGKDVLVEKPLATTTKEAREIVLTAHKTGRHLMVDFQNRFSPPFVEARARVESGEFGLPVTAWARLANSLSVPREMLSWSGQSGPHWFLFPHIIDMVCWLCDREVRRVMAYGRKGVLQEMGRDTWDALQAMLFFDDCCATVETSWIMPDSRPNLVDFRMVLQGTKEVIDLNPLRADIEIAGEKYEWPITSGFSGNFGRVYGWQTLPMIHFVDRILANQQPLCNGKESFHNTAVIEAIVRSVKSGKIEAVETL